MTSTQYETKDNKTNNTHSFYSLQTGTASVLINDDVFNDIRDEEILRA